MPRIVNDASEIYPHGKSDKEKHTDMFYTRVDEVVVVMLKDDRFIQSKRNDELIKIVTEKFNCEMRQAYNYIKEAKKEIHRLGSLKKEKTFKKAIQDREYIIAAAKADGDNKLALDAMKDRDKLFGHYIEETKTETTNKNIDMSLFTEYGLERLKRGDRFEDVLLDPKSLKQNDANANSSSR